MNKIQPIEDILEEMCEVKTAREFRHLDYRLAHEIKPYLELNDPETNKAIEHYARIWRVLKEHFYIQQDMKREAEVTVEELNYGIE